MQWSAYDDGLAGGRILEVRYDHGKGLFSVVYEGSERRRGSLNGANGACGPIASTTTTTTTDVHTIQCEMRCDLDNWASSLDIIVDPPPQFVAAPSTRDKGVVMVNGAHVAVDVKELKALSKRKRIIDPSSTRSATDGQRHTSSTCQMGCGRRSGLMKIATIP